MSKNIPTIPNFSDRVSEFKLNKNTSPGWIDCPQRDADGKRCIHNTGHEGPHIINHKVVEQTTKPEDVT